MSKSLFPLAKVGKKVSIKRRTGFVDNGVVCETPAVVTRNSFVRVNVGTKQKPAVVSVRPSQLNAPLVF